MSWLQYESCTLCTRRCCASICCCCRVDAPHDTSHHTHSIVPINAPDPDPKDTFMFQVIVGLRSAAAAAEKAFASLDADGENKNHQKNANIDWKEPSVMFNIDRIKNHGLVAMKDYSPRLFRQSRLSQGVSTADYLASWNYTFETMPKAKPGAGRSNSLFLTSADNRFILKTLPHHEVVTLRHILRAYMAYLEEHRCSRLLRFVGLHRFRRGNQFLYVAVMNNIFYSPSNLAIDWKYDLKGRKIKPSSERRLQVQRLRGTIWPKTTIFKDNQLDRVFFPKYSETLRKVLQEDARFLCSQNCIDYSLLVGAHQRSEDDKEDLEENTRSSVSMLKTGAGIRSDGFLRNEIYFIGVIDFLSRYGNKKKIANCCKRFLWEPSTLSTVPPVYYRDRWIAYLDHVIRSERPPSSTRVVIHTAPAPGELCKEAKEEKDDRPPEARGLLEDRGSVDTEPVEVVVRLPDTTQQGAQEQEIEV